MADLRRFGVLDTALLALVLALAGGVLGIALAAVGVRLLIGAAPLDLPRLADVSLDGRVLGFASLISLVTGIAFGILPALRSAAAHPQEALKSGSYTTTEGRRGVRLRGVLVGVEAALRSWISSRSPDGLGPCPGDDLQSQFAG